MALLLVQVRTAILGRPWLICIAEPRLIRTIHTPYDYVLLFSLSIIVLCIKKKQLTDVEIFFLSRRGSNLADISPPWDPRSTVWIIDPQEKCS
jgi:hypothetical protein